MPRLIDYTGRKYSHLLLIRKVRAGRQGTGAVWLAQCDCGEVREVVARDVSNGRTHSCGKCQLGRDSTRKKRVRTERHTKWEAQAYSRYFRTAANRKRQFTLEPAQFFNIIHSKCTYCGNEPGKAETGLNELTLVVDSGSYTLDNVEPACRRCRTLKGTNNHQEFLDICIEIALHTADSGI